MVLLRTVTAPTDSVAPRLTAEELAEIAKTAAAIDETDTLTGEIDGYFAFTQLVRRLLAEHEAQNRDRLFSERIGATPCQ